jgi:FkbM family methyltransferase
MITQPVFRFPIGRFERLGRRLYCGALRRVGVNKHVIRSQGARFIVDTTDMIDHAVAIDGIWDGDQLEALARVCREQRVDAFFDIGANSGIYSVLMALKGLAGEVVAFEPDPGNFARLTANLSLNRLTDKVRALPWAVGDCAAEVILIEAGEYNRGESWIAHPDLPDQPVEGPKHKVRQVRFDDEFALAGKTLLIKMDVEGYEFQALSGMQRTLHDNACYLQVELYSDRLEELKELFTGMGYRYVYTHGIDHYFTNMPADA